MLNKYLNHIVAGGVIFLVLIVGFVFWYAPHSADAHAPVVEMTSEGFSPEVIEIPLGSEVLFINSDENQRWPASNVHPTHEEYSDFDPQKPVMPSSSWSFKFEQEGEWEFHDHLYPQFTGKIVVDENIKDVHVEQTADEVSGQTLFSKIVDLVRKFFNPFFQVFNFGQSGEIAGTDDKEEFVLPAQVNMEELKGEFSTQCDSYDFMCLSGELREITKKYGPAVAVEILAHMQEAGEANLSVDDHQLAHEIGRQAAESYGANSKSFLLCPMSAYNGGCQHGFFEYVLGEAGTSRKAADSICGALDVSEFSQKDVFYCYHGVGHGIMMAAAYDLERALAQCEAFESGDPREGCWQGLFMENVSAGMSGTARSGMFIPEEPLAPCDRIAEKYRYQCYINHAGWLVRVFELDMGRAAQACLEAKEAYRPACLQSLGLMVSNPSWQPGLRGGEPSANPHERSRNICELFPEDYRQYCVIGVVDNLMNFDGPNIARSQEFCGFVENSLSYTCYSTIGLNLSRQSTNSETVNTQCGLLETNAKEACLEGAES